MLVILLFIDGKEVGYEALARQSTAKESDMYTKLGNCLYISSFPLWGFHTVILIRFILFYFCLILNFHIFIISRIMSQKQNIRLNMKSTEEL